MYYTYIYAFINVYIVATKRLNDKKIIFTNICFFKFLLFYFIFFQILQSFSGHPTLRIILTISFLTARERSKCKIQRFWYLGSDSRNYSRIHRHSRCVQRTFALKERFFNEHSSRGLIPTKWKEEKRTVRLFLVCSWDDEARLFSLSLSLSLSPKVSNSYEETGWLMMENFARKATSAWQEGAAKETKKEKKERKLWERKIKREIPRGQG